MKNHSNPSDIVKNAETWNILVGHFRTITRTLLDGYAISSAAGQKTIIGSAREGFVNEFLKKHLPSTLGITTGAIFDKHMQAGCYMNQEDIIVYDARFPVVPLGGMQSLVLIESVKATIEVKSELSEDAIKQATAAAAKLKRVCGTDKGIFCMLIAYMGPAQCETVLKWLDKAEQENHELGVTNCLDSVVVLKPSYIVHAPNKSIGLAPKYANEDYKWIYACPNSDDSLLVGFYQLLVASCEPVMFDIAGYLNNGCGLYDVNVWPQKDRDAMSKDFVVATTQTQPLTAYTQTQ